MKDNSSDILEITRLTQAWIEQFVIGLQLCPFAKQPFDQGRIRYRVVEDIGMEKQLTAFWEEIEKLTETDVTELSTTLLIFPAAFPGFMDYLDFYELAEELLEDQGKDDLFQLASFHPNYQFEGAGEEDVTNYTNRSPYPMVHILRVAEVAAAIAGYADINAVPEHNILKMKELGVGGVKEILKNLPHQKI